MEVATRKPLIRSNTLVLYYSIKKLTWTSCATTAPPHKKNSAGQALELTPFLLPKFGDNHQTTCILLFTINTNYICSLDIVLHAPRLVATHGHIPSLPLLSVMVNPRSIINKLNFGSHQLNFNCYDPDKS